MEVIFGSKSQLDTLGHYGYTRTLIKILIFYQIYTTSVNWITVR